MIRKEIEILRSYGFLILLVVMIVNDLFLKLHYRSMINGESLISSVRCSNFYK